MNQPKKTERQTKVSIRWAVAGIAGLFVVASTFVFPAYANLVIEKINTTTGLGFPRVPDKPFHLGLDLQGGTQLTYQANVDAILEKDRAQAVEGVRDVIERRVNGLGIGEPNIETSQVSDSYRLLVELPGVTDVKTAIAMIGETPILEFKEEDTSPPKQLTQEEKDQIAKENAAALARAQDLQKRVLAKGADFSAIAKEQTEDAATKANGGYLGYLGRNTGNDAIYLWAVTSKQGDVSDRPIQTPEGYNIVKRGGDRDGAVQFEASHILICFVGAKGCTATSTKAEALDEAKSILAKATTKNFADLAKQFSSDPGSKDSGGKLGSFGKGAMIPAFEDAVSKANVGQIVGPIETEYGYHLIYKTGEDTPKEFEISRILIRTKRDVPVIPVGGRWKTTGLSGKQLTHAEVVSDPQTGVVEVSLRFNAEGRDLFRDITARNIGKQVGIFLDGSPISIPRVNSTIPDGQAVITGQFTLSEAKLLATRLNAGALPVPVELISQQSLGASLGVKSLDLSLRAGLIGVALVMLFMILYYRLPGLISSLALLLYISMSLAIFKLFGVTLTLAGIAGFIMSIGIAVDANILIFERTKEELRAGKHLKTAVEDGFLRAWPSIRDSNISNLITSIILIWFGSSFVKGFAITLALGVLVSMFSAISVSRTLLRFVTRWLPPMGNWLVPGSKNI